MEKYQETYARGITRASSEAAKNAIRTATLWRIIAGTFWSTLFTYVIIWGCSHLFCGAEVSRFSFFSPASVRFGLLFVAGILLRSSQFTGSLLNEKNTASKT